MDRTEMLARVDLMIENLRRIREELAAPETTMRVGDITIECEVFHGNEWRTVAQVAHLASGDTLLRLVGGGVFLEADDTEMTARRVR